MPVGWTVRTGAAMALLGVVLGLAACSSSGKPASPATSSGASDEQAIRTAYVTFFNGSTPAAEKIKLLQNGPEFAAAIDAQANSPLAKSTEATVSSVRITGAGRADVVYSISLAGKPALTDQTGTAVRTGGTWQVGDGTFCALLTLQGAPPAACAGPSAAASSSASSSASASPS